MTEYRSATAVLSCALLAGTFFHVDCNAAPSVADSAAPAVQVFGGVVIDETFSGFGHAFFRSFVSYWRDNALSDQYLISIHERVNARNGSQVWVEYARRRIFQAALPPSHLAIRAISEKAVEQVYENIMNVDVQRLLMRDSDMAADEI